MGEWGKWRWMRGDRRGLARRRDQAQQVAEKTLNGVQKNSTSNDEWLLLTVNKTYEEDS